ncbi:hypothetical protein ACE1TH_02630 [Shouchella sp. JSM 1781072]|nr:MULTISPECIES: hypothetical protein [Bacillaceae]
MVNRDQNRINELYQSIWCAANDGERKRYITKLALLQAQVKTRRG